MLETPKRDQTLDAPKKAKLRVYTSLCRPILEYADVEPFDLKKKIYDIDLVQNTLLAI